MESVNRSNGKPKSKAPTNNYKAHVSIAPSSFSKSELEGDSRACTKYDHAVKLLVDGTMNRKKANTHLSSTKNQETRQLITSHTGLTFKLNEKDGKYYYNTHNKHGKVTARPLSADAFKSDLSAQHIAAYWHVTSSYPKSIAHKVKNKGSQLSANTARREQSPSGGTTGGERQSSPNRKRGSKNSTSSTNLTPFTIGSGSTQYVKIDGELVVAPPEVNSAEEDRRSAQSEPDQDNDEDHYEDDPPSIFGSDDGVEETQATPPSRPGRGGGRGGKGGRQR